MKRRTFLAAYTFRDASGNPGNGRTFVTFSGSLTRPVIEEMERITKENNRFASLFITNMVELDEVSES